MIKLRDICTAYVEGYIHAKLTEQLLHGKIQGATLDVIKETAVKCLEDYVAQLKLSESDKEEMKRNHKQWADLVLEGIKERLRESGKIEK